MFAGRTLWRVLVSVVALCAIGLGASAGPASAEDTVWLCKPGDADDMCAGTIAGTISPPPGQPAGNLTYTRPDDAPVDCFYLYPTQSPQPTPNSDLAKDGPLRRVAVQQARMFSTVCDVYAPMYRQVTNGGPQLSHNENVEIAYQSALSGWKDYLQNHNQGRGFILLGHSQGSAHIARLIDEEIDTNADLRSRMVGAFAPGANIHVPIGELSGGMYDNVPACSEVGQIGCLVAFSLYKGNPGATPRFSRLDLGYWIYKMPRPDPNRFEVVCVNPARLDGGDGGLEPLVNFDYLLDVPAGPETAEPWGAQPDFYTAECERQGGAHWLDLRTLNLPGDTRTDLGSFVASGNEYHVPEVNLTEANLLKIARLQTDGYLVRADAMKERPAVAGKRNSTNRKLKSSRTRTKKLSKKLRKAKKHCRAARKSGIKVKARCRAPKKIKRNLAKSKRRTKSLNRQVTTLTARLKEIDRIIG